MSGLSLVAFLAWMGFMNTALISPNDQIGRTVYNQAAIVVYSIGLTYVAFRMGAREARLEQSTWSTLESLPLGLAVLTPGYLVEFANRALLQGLGYKTKDVRGRPAKDFLSEEVIREISRDHARRAAGQPTTYKLRVRTHAGDRHDAIVTLLPYLREGKYDGALAVVNDVSEVVELRKEAEHHSSLAGFLSDAVTHDLSNAMQAALLHIQLANQSSSTDGKRLARALREAEASVQRSVRLIKEVKQIAMAERDDWPRERVSLGVLLSEGVAAVRSGGSTPARVDIGSPLGEMEVEANSLLPVALAKVVEEAAQTRQGSTGQPVVRARPVSGGAEVSVEGLARSFDPADFEALTRGPEGYQWGETPWRCGVRIALASAVLRAHGGSVSAEAGPDGKGTTFVLHIPASRPAPYPTDETAPKDPKAGAAPSAPAYARPSALQPQGH